MPRNNKDKETPVDESILEETPPNINEPQTPDPDDKDNVDPESKEEPKVEPEVTPEPEPAKEPEVEPEVEKKEEKEPEKEESIETPDQKEQRYKDQQTEAQIQVARNKSLVDKVDEAANLPEPTVEELKAFTARDGVDWEDLSISEQAMWKRTYIADKRFALVNESVQSVKQIDEWASKVDTFIDESDGKPEFLPLSGHEADFRKFCMIEAHRGTPIDILLGAFLHKLPAPEKKRGSLLNTGGGGEKTEDTGKIIDADAVATLRVTNPREYKRLLKAGKIQVEV